MSSQRFCFQPLHWFMPETGPKVLRLFSRLPVLVQSTALVAVFYLLVIFSMGAAPFVYFQF